MLPTASILILFLLLPEFLSSSTSSFLSSFQYKGFQGANISLGGAAHINPTRDGALQLCNETGEQGESRAFYSSPIQFRSLNSSPVYSFSTTFVFAMNTGKLIFVVAPAPDVNPSRNIFRIEIDASHNDVDFQISGTFPEPPRAAGYRLNGSFVNLAIGSGNQIELRLVYNSSYRESVVQLIPPDQDFHAPLIEPMFSILNDLSDIFSENMYVGFAANCVRDKKLLFAWNFTVENQTYPTYYSTPAGPPWGLLIRIFTSTYGVLITCVAVCICCIIRKRKFSELIEDWEGELNYISHRLKYKDLYMATKGFKDTEVLGKGGFGKVFRGVMPRSNVEIALKKISHDSSQGMKEFIAEIVTLGRLRHRNVVPLLGYCRRKGELFLVYEYMPNGSLHKFLHGCQSTLKWPERFSIIIGVACGLFYLHEGWEQVVIHRDIKPANVLLDAQLNARLGDFGLAKLHAHGSDPTTTKIVGTIGYIAPEHMRTGKATKSSDMFSFGILLLEIASGRNPIDTNALQGNVVLLDWVHSLWNENQILASVDPNLDGDYSIEEVELVLKMGLLCCHPQPDFRPSARDIMGYLEDTRSFREDDCSSALNLWVPNGYEGNQSTMVSPTGTDQTGALSISHSLKSVGR